MSKNKLLMPILKNIPIVLFIAIFLIFGILTPSFLSVENFIDILTGVAYVGILATGITFVIITGGIDLSIGSVVFVTGIIAAKLMILGVHPIIALIACVLIGGLYGAFNAFFIVKMKMIPFLVTLCTMVAGRGVGIYLTKSQQIRFPAEIIKYGNVRILGLPLPIYILIIIVAIAFLIQKRTAVGRRVYAIGYDFETARKAGIHVDKIQAFAYILCGVFAAIGGLMCVFQMGGSIDPAFGDGIEFDAIAAAVLGGASLSGGIGSVFPGTIIGALIVQMLNAGLIYLGVDVYFQPVITFLVIFFAVFVDSIRTTYINKIERRNIRVEEKEEELVKAAYSKDVAG